MEDIDLFIEEDPADRETYLFESHDEDLDKDRRQKQKQIDEDLQHVRYTELTIDDIELYTCNTCWNKLPAAVYATKYRKAAVSRTCSGCIQFLNHTAEVSYEQSKARNNKRYRYGLTCQQLTQMVEQQDHKCQICHRPEEPNGRRFAIDHDHKTGKVRGYLCPSCNTLLGFAYDDPYILRSAIDYLEDHATKEENATH